MNKTVAFVNLPPGRTRDPTTVQESRFWEAQWRRRLDPEKGREATDKHGLIPFQAPEVPFTGIYLLGFFRDAGWTIRFVDAASHDLLNGVGEREVSDLLTESEAGLFLFSPYTTNYPHALTLLKQIRCLMPSATCVIGGHHASAAPGLTLADGFDLVIAGRGEEALRLLAAGDWGRLKELPNVLHPDSSRREIPARRDNPDPGDLPFAAYEVLPARYRRSYYTRLFTSHGCPYQCAFCSSKLWTGVKPWFKSIERIGRELDLIQQHIEFEEIYVGDETFTVRPTHAVEVARLLARREVKWGAETRVNLASAELMQTLGQLGCLEMDFGLETLDLEILRRVRKRIVPEQAEAAFRNTRAAGIRTHVNLMLGLPGETHETARATVRRICEWMKNDLISTVDYFITVPYPGSDLFDHPEQHGITLHCKNWELFREDQLPVYDLETLNANEIYELWLEGLDAFASV